MPPFILSQNTMFARQFALCCLTLGCSLALTGCGPMLDATVTGAVTLDGTPLRYGTVTFHPIDTKRGFAAEGEIDAAGNYKLFTGGYEGILNGEYKVTVVGSDTPPATDGTSPATPPKGTPVHYGLLRQTPLRYKIRSGPNSISLALDSTEAKSKLPEL